MLHLTFCEDLMVLKKSFKKHFNFNGYDTKIITIEHCIYARIRVFSVRILPYNDKIGDSVFMREHTGQKNPVFRHILRSGMHLFEA